MGQGWCWQTTEEQQQLTENHRVKNKMGGVGWMTEPE